MVFSDSNDSASQAEIQRKIRHQLTRMLAKREHSQKECLDKLSQKGFEEHDIWDVLSQFVAKDIQSDARFTFHFIRNAIYKGQGWFRIKQSLQAHTLDTACINDALQELTPNWFDLAYAAKEKRFGREVETDFQAKQKQMRFLQYRGFSLEEIDHAVHHRCE